MKKVTKLEGGVKMVKNLETIWIVVAVSFGLVFVAGCASDAQTGALIGTAIGASAGQAIGGDTEATLIGAAVGAGAGYMLGSESDRKKSQEQIYYLNDQVSTQAVNITNSNSSVVQVKLRKSGVGYVGPRGEYYNSLPTEDQLRPIYGF
jgi:hypothetical protein